ncbi:MAG: hypothetical protein ACRBHB_17225 [Arenicella sp.]
MTQGKRWEVETRQRQEKFNKGLKGLVDFVTGKSRKTKHQNEQQMKTAQRRDEQEKDTLIFTYLEQRRSLQRRIERLKSYEYRSDKHLNHDFSQYREIKQGKRDVFKRIQNNGKAVGAVLRVDDEVRFR